jgi:hypothetical protein
VYNGNFDITRMLDQSNLRVQRCRLIFWVECSVGGYLTLAKTRYIPLSGGTGGATQNFKRNRVKYFFTEICILCQIVKYVVFFNRSIRTKQDINKFRRHRSASW